MCQVMSVMSQSWFHHCSLQACSWWHSVEHPQCSMDAGQVQTQRPASCQGNGTGQGTPLHVPCPPMPHLRQAPAAVLARQGPRGALHHVGIHQGQGGSVGGGAQGACRQRSRGGVGWGGDAAEGRRRVELLSCGAEACGELLRDSAVARLGSSLRDMAQVWISPLMGL